MNQKINLFVVFLITGAMFCGSITVGAAEEHKVVNEVKQSGSVNELMELLFPSGAFLSEPHPEMTFVGAIKRNVTVRDYKFIGNVNEIGVTAFMLKNVGRSNISIASIVVSKDSSPGMSLSAPFGLLSRKEAGSSTHWTENRGLPMTSTINFNSRDVIRPGETAEIEILVGSSRYMHGDTLKINVDSITWSDGSNNIFSPTRTESVHIEGEMIKYP